MIQRTLYSVEQLQIDKYINDRAKIANSLKPDSLNHLKADLQRKLAQKTIAPYRLLSDLTQYLHIIDDNDDEFRVLERALDHFKNTTQENFRKSNFGAILMKVLHHFRKDELALKV